jgi:hypothetical protein
MTTQGNYIYPPIGWAIHGEDVTVTQISTSETDGAGTYLVTEGGYHPGHRNCPARHFVMDLGGLTGIVRINGIRGAMAEDTVQALCALADAIALGPAPGPGQVATTSFNVRTDHR